MVRLEQYGEQERRHLLSLPCPTYDTSPFVKAVTVANSRITIISTAGLHRKSDRPFGVGESGYRLIPGDCKANDLVMSHISTNFDRTGFQLDLNTVFPVDRLNEMAEAGEIGSVAAYHYSFMGATDPTQMEQEARALASIMKKDRVNAVLLVPV
ncbi:MAG: glycine/sarcosine/betaine reductase selenoprotein B family protein [Desulfocapsaceae bacterium]|jgi:D-proline reductase (dithiol) PrdB|nr:glycine/sarcosine/betaine reductase selenoprotein B family protein [Desulfocapsaceae bacterium]